MGRKKGFSPYSEKRNLVGKLTDKQIGPFNYKTNYNRYSSQFNKNMRKSLKELKELLK